MRVLVVQRDHVADIGLIVVEMIDEGTAPGVPIHRPARGVNHGALLVLLGVEFPQLLEADAVFLRAGLLRQTELLDQLLGQRPAHALGEDGVLGVQLHARLEARLLLAVAADTHDAGGDALDRAVFVVEHFRGREAGEDFDAHALGLLGQPAADVPQRDNIVAVVVDLVRHGPDRQRKAVDLGQHHELLVFDRHVQRCAPLFPVREQLVHRTRLHDCTGEDVRTHLRALFQHDDGEFLALFLCQLLQPDRGGQTRRTTTDDNDINFHRFAFHVPAFLRLFQSCRKAVICSGHLPAGHVSGEPTLRGSKRLERGCNPFQVHIKLWCGP